MSSTSKAVIGGISVILLLMVLVANIGWMKDALSKSGGFFTNAFGAFQGR